jgi:hypothetical protein
MVRQRASTGGLLSDSFIDATLADIHARYGGLDDGEIADYIPILAEADPRWFGLSLIESAGTVHEAGDVDIEFSIQSISKAFVFALVCQARSSELVHERVGVNNTGLVFNSVMAIVFGIGQGVLVTLVFNVLVTAAPKHLAGDVGAIRGTAQNLASAVGTAVMGALLVTVLSAGLASAADDHPDLPPELVEQVDLDNANFVSNDELRDVLAGTTATPEQVEHAVELNSRQRLRTLKLGFLILAGISLIAAVPASRLPKYRPDEIPDPAVDDTDGAGTRS